MIEHIRDNGSLPPAPDDRVRILDYAAVLLTEWRTILLVLAGTLVVAAAILWARPDSYVSRTTLVPVPSGTDARSQMLAAGLPPGLAARMGGGGGNNQRIVGAILKSQILRDSLAGRVAADADEESQIHFLLEKRTRVRQNGDGSITVDVAAPEPALATRIAGAYPELINEIATRLSVTAAQQKEQVINAQLADAHDRLVRSEEALLAFQKSLGAADIQEQARQTLSAAVQFEQAIIQQELEIARLRRTATPDNPRLRAAIADLEALRLQRQRVTSGTSGTDLFLAQGELPEIRAEATRLTRTFVRDEQVYVALSAELAGAQVEVKDNTGLVTVLDPASVPLAPSGSAVRALILAVLLGLVLGTAAAFGRAYLRRVPDDPDNRTFMLALEGFRTDLGSLVPHRRRSAARMDR